MWGLDLTTTRCFSAVSHSCVGRVDQNIHCSPSVLCLKQIHTWKQLLHKMSWLKTTKKKWKKMSFFLCVFSVCASPANREVSVTALCTNRCALYKRNNLHVAKEFILYINICFMLQTSVGLWRFVPHSNLWTNTFWIKHLHFHKIHI